MPATPPSEGEQAEEVARVGKVISGQEVAVDSEDTRRTLEENVPALRATTANDVIPVTLSLSSVPRELWLGIIWDLLQTPRAIACFAQTCHQALETVVGCFSRSATWQRFKIYAKFASLGLKYELVQPHEVYSYHFEVDTLRSFRLNATSFGQLREAHFHRFCLVPDDICYVLQSCTNIRTLAFHGSNLIPESLDNLSRM